ncbi:MAG TPA: hypothetical protein VFR94_21790, partial [Nitrososphaeraceae archaeon]|nr:hypothetical protein [Nitrososphaeraceae archaeon]
MLTTTAILCSLLLTAVWALGDIMTKQYADAQMRGAMDAGNMMMAGSKNVTSSIDLMNIINQAIQSKVNVSLSEAITAAEGIGNNSHAAAVYLGEENGYLVYNIMLIDPSMNFSKVIVDPGNGHLLFGKQLSKEDMMKEEMGRHHKMTSMMMGGPQQGRGMMMGPGIMSQGQGPGPGMMMGGERNMTMGPGMMMGGPQQGRGMMMGPGIMSQGQGPGPGM